MFEWQPIETAPKDRPIWVYHDHNADPYEANQPTSLPCILMPDLNTPDDGRLLTAYGAWAESVSYKSTPGQCVAVWGGGYYESGDEYGWRGYMMPDWWFEAGSEFEVALSPTHWMEKPNDPQDA